MRSVDLEKFQPGAHLGEELMRPKAVFLNAHQLCKRVVARQAFGYSHLEPSKVDKSLRSVADFAEFHGRLREHDLKTEKRGCQLFHSRVRWPLVEVFEECVLFSELLSARFEVAFVNDVCEHAFETFRGVGVQFDGK